jgi:hypothetical protein
MHELTDDQRVFGWLVSGLFREKKYRWVVADNKQKRIRLTSLRDQSIVRR